MKNYTKLAAGVSLALASVAANAGSFQALTSESVGTEAATTGSLAANIAADTIVITTGTNYAVNDRLTVTLPDGATFANSVYTLEQSTAAAGGTGNGDLTEFVLITATTAGATSIEFKTASAIPSGSEFILNGSSVAGDDVDFTLPSLASGGSITIDAEARDVIGAYDNFSTAGLFYYANEFTAGVDTVANGIVDVNDNRLSFTGGASTDTIALEFTKAAQTNTLSLTDDDKVDIVLSGDMSDIASISLTATSNRGNFTIDTAANTATFSASASDVFAAASTILTATVTGSSALATRTFTVQADANFDAETDKNLIAAATSAGEWTINGLQAKVSHLSLNASGFVSWLKVINEGTTAAEVSADIIWTLADGTEGSVTSASLGSADAGGIATISEATILAAMGNPTQLADVSMTVTVAGQVNLVHLTAEKKASDGRLPIPVYYSNSGNTRNWFQ